MMKTGVTVLSCSANVITKVNLLISVLKNVTSKVSLLNPSMFLPEKPPLSMVEVVEREKELK